MSRKKQLSAALFGSVTALILWITVLNREVLIGPTIIYKPFHALISFIKEIQKGRFGTNLLGNIILFVPVGLLFPFVSERQKWHWSVGVGISFSLMIEITQLITSRGCFDPDDIILNTIGTVIGWLAYRCLHKHKLDIDDNTTYNTT